MHTKKANVAKEDLEGIQSRQRAQQKQQQSGPGQGVSAPLPPQRQPPMDQQYQHGQQANYQGQQANYPPGRQGNYPQGGQDRMGPMHGQMADPNRSAFPQGHPGNQGNQGFHGGMGQQQGYLTTMGQQQSRLNSITVHVKLFVFFFPLQMTPLMIGLVTVDTILVLPMKD